MIKKIYTIIAVLCFTASVFAQAPQKMSYQVVIRNSSDELVTSTPVGMRISIIQDSMMGSAIYVETQTTSTNANGSVSVAIGTGTPLTGTFAGIDWAAGPYFIKTETDPTGGTSYTISSTNELMSVPYALYAANGGTTGPAGPAGAPGTSGFTHYLGEAFDGGIIYYLFKGSDGIEHGLIVALTESTAAWQTSPTLVNANRSEDGAYNTALMTGSPAKTYITSLGAGWYLPSIDELTKLWDNKYHAQKALRAGGNTLLQSILSYWSSTEFDAPYAYFFYFGTGDYSYYGKTNTFTVRGVRAF
jgi:hypothetical protein